MNVDFSEKYRPFVPVRPETRSWPAKELTKAPVWCSVDMRDGNQALVRPLSPEDKLRFFSLLVKLGFKEIEIGYPSSSATEFDFTRKLIESGEAPDDVWLQVLTAARELFRFERIGGKDMVLPVCSGDMLFNAFDEYLGFLDSDD